MNVSNATPLITVAMPVYNGEKYLAEAIDSILVQTFTNFELIIIDDGSTDNSLQVLQEYHKRDARIRLIARENRNLATTLNEIIDLARGKWIARMDQDDIALPQRFERQLQWLEQTGADITGSWVRRFGSSDNRVVRLRKTDEAIKMEMLFCSPLAHPTVIILTSLVKQLRYDSAWEKAEDYDLWERAAEAGWKMANVPEVLLLYRVHESQISTVTSVRQHQLTQQIRLRYWKHVFKAMQLDSLGIDEVLKIYEPVIPILNMGLVDRTLTELLQNNYGEARNVILNHAMRLYFRIAADCPNATSRWVKLNREVGERTGLFTLLQLWILHNFKIHSNGHFFAFLKKLYISLIRNK